MELVKHNVGHLQMSFGLHPWYVKSTECDVNRDLEHLKSALSQYPDAFLGELGLDFSGDKELVEKTKQIEAFEAQLSIETHRPAVFHFVQAHGASIDFLKNHPRGGFVHGFSGSFETAKTYMDQGLLMSFGPGLLNPNYKKARETFVQMPDEFLLIESDTPSSFLDRTSPVVRLEEVYKEAAKLRQTSVEALKSLVAQNFQSLQASSASSGQESQSSRR